MHYISVESYPGLQLRAKQLVIFLSKVISFRFASWNQLGFNFSDRRSCAATR
jgi:hypothetical protein